MPHENSTFPRHALAILPVTRLELPGWGKVMSRFGVSGYQNDARWKSAPTRVMRGKMHGYAMDLDLSNWSERTTYFLGRFYDLPLQLLVAAAVRNGDRVADVGANIGMITLLAARAVGPTGRVDSFEPNPTCQDRIRAHLARNRIAHVHLHPFGLSDAPATLRLQVLANHTGLGTMSELTDEQRAVLTSTVDVKVDVGDPILSQDERPIDLVKIDVEGFELRVLRGIRQSLERWRPAVVMEMSPGGLKRAGTDISELIELMNGLGYRPYQLGTRRRGIRHTLSLRPLADATSVDVVDVLWSPQTGKVHDRLAAAGAFA